MSDGVDVTETLSDGLRRAFDVVVRGADIERRRSERLVSIGRTLRLPGFRPGKVPMPVLRQRYGAAVSAEVLEDSVKEATQKVLTDRGLRPATQPRINFPGAAEATDAAAGDLRFQVELELLPDFEVPDLRSIALTRLRAEATQEVVDAALARVATANRTLEPVEEERGAETGEILTVDYEGRVEGTPFPGGAAQDVNVEVGGAGFIPGFSEQFAGLRAGGTGSISVAFPEDYGAKDLAGKEATFAVTVKTLARPVVPALDDVLAAKLGFDDLAALRTAVTGQIQREYEQMSRLKLKRALLDALAERATFAVPEGMVEQEFGQIWARVEADRKAGQLDEDDRGKDEETLRAEYRGIADRRVRLGLLLAEIGRANGVAVTAEEMTRAMRAEASRYPGQESKVIEFFRKNPPAAEGLRGPLFEDKVVDYVLELAQVADQSATPEELAQTD